MDSNLAGKTVVITGGSGGIGRGLVKGFASEGANVVSLDVDPGDALVEDAKADDRAGRVVALQTDITMREQVDAAVAQIHDIFGPVDVLVNNAGGGTKPAPFQQLTEADRRWAIALNEDGLVNCIQATVPDMLQARHGAIVNIASNAALLGSRNGAFYSGMKGFMISMSKALAREWGGLGVRLNCIAPGWIVPHDEAEVGPTSFWTRFGFETMGRPADMQKQMEEGTLYNMPILPIPRLGRPEDIAHLAIFLASDLSGYLTGQTISVSGGAYMP